jgi:cyclic beta-1,2-glucan synthetase
LREPESTIDAAYQRLSGLPRPVIERSRSAEWLLDNHYVVQRTLRSLKEEFPLGFERKLRLVTDGPSRGLALAYLVARELVAIGQGRVDIESLTNAIGQVQAVRSLTIAELWALPALLRLGLLEQLAAAAGAIPGAVPVSGEQRQVEEDAGRVIANVVRSLRTLETADWKQFFEAVSAVDRILAQDPSSLYRQMVFETRDHYRKAIEEVAAGTTMAMRRPWHARLWPSGPARERPAHHVGYFLAAPGRLELEALLRARPRWKERWRRLRARPTLTYLGAIGALSAGGTAAMVFAFLQHVSPLIAAVLLLTAVVPLVSAAVTLVNALLTRLLPPRALPKLDFSRGIPPPWRTLVAVPALLSDDEEVDELLAAPEIRFLANRDAELHVALLTDLLDAPTEQMPNDAALVQHAADGIAALNARYGDNEHGPFHLFHRARRWNEREGCWMGWERKRGKLAQLNQLILNGRAATAPSGDESFALHIGDAGFYPAVRFVIVLDADTDLPRDAARQMAGALAHPLNRAEFGGEPERVTAGYTILQPRVEISPLGAGASRFSALFSPAPVSIRTRARCRTSTRTCSAKAASSARASTTSTISSAACTTSCPRTRYSATISSKGCTAAPAC